MNLTMSLREAMQVNALTAAVLKRNAQSQNPRFDNSNDGGGKAAAKTRLCCFTHTMA